MILSLVINFNDMYSNNIIRIKFFHFIQLTLIFYDNALYIILKEK